MYKFAGFINFEPDQYQEKERLRLLTLMGKQLSCRSSNEQQYFDNGQLSLVFRPLSMGVTQEQQQLIWNEDKTRFCLLDGRIYNHLELRSQLQSQHQFCTNSDAEIVLQLYETFGAEALNYLNGMFALVIWDAQKQELFLARDRLGLKPLYYTQVGSQLLFGSNLKSLLVHPDAPNQPQWLDLTIFNPTSSYVKGIECLPGGHYFTYSATEPTVTPQCYWDIKNYLVTEPVSPFAPIQNSKFKIQNDSPTPQDYIREYGSLLADSIKKRLIGDAPVGAFLSGGLDSGIIVAAASVERQDIHCFSILEQSYSLEVGDAEEARQLCDYLNLPFHPVFFDREKFLAQIDFSLETFEYFIWLFDLPRFELEWLFKHELHRYARTLIPELQVMLLGQGAAEFTGGYSNPFDDPSQSWEDYSDKRTEPEQPLSLDKAQILMSNPQAKTYLDSFWQQHRSKTTGYTPFQEEMFSRISSLQGYNLWHEDRSSFSQGIEVSIPFLDHRLVEYLAAIPPQLHPQLFWDKTILREMARQWLPDDYAYRRKSHRRPPGSLHQLRKKILAAIFPAFREKYLESGECLFSQSTIVTWYEQANTDSEAGKEAMHKLFNGMAMIVFEHLCYTRGRSIALDRYQERSPLSEFHGF